jgi:hypothetical protein
MAESDRSGKGYSYHVSTRDLKKWMSISAEMKLEWLEEINTFISKHAPEKSKRIMQKFRNGEI